jgi:vanillate O-demethylase monooxygenase subunit
MIYIWIGDGEPTEPAPEWLAWEEGYGATLRGNIQVGASYRLMVDNLMDDAHATHLHELLASDGHIARPIQKIETVDDKVLMTNDIPDTNLAPFFKAMYRKPGNVDQRVTTTWHPVSAIRIKSTVRPVGADISEEVGVDSAHVLTPETETTCHYFWSFARNANKEDHLYTQKLNEALGHIFKTEDSWIAEAQQRYIRDRDFWELKPALMAQDKAAVMVRRAIDKMLKTQEEATAAE